MQMLKTNISRNKTVPVFEKQDTVQVLSLDGGGLKGLFTASIIKVFEKNLGHSITEHFDIITGTSTGGLLALALGLGCSGAKIQSFYINNGNLIFPCKGPNGLYRQIRWIFAPKYANKKLKETLLSLFDTNGRQPLLKDSSKRLVIPTFLAAESKPRLLKTPHANRYKNDWSMPAWSVALATSAAPTYLPKFSYGGKNYLDGGLWANNPSMIGLVEALDLGADLCNVRILNLGTTQSIGDSIYFYPFTTAIRRVRFPRGGILSWGSIILSTVMEANSYAMSNMYMNQILNEGNFASVNSTIERGIQTLDKVDNNMLVELGLSAGESTFPHLDRYFQHSAKPYIPCKEAMINGK